MHYYDYLSQIDPGLAEEVKKALKESEDKNNKLASSPPSAKGAPNPENKAGPGRPASTGAKTVSDTSKTVSNTSKTTVDPDKAKTVVKVPRNTNSTQEIVYLPKKDFPKAPNGTIGSTENSWKVPAGIGRHLQAQTDVNNQQNQILTTPIQASGYDKTPKPRSTIVSHLQEGNIASKKRLDGDNASETFKVVIQGNGAGIMKPQVNTLAYIDRQVSKTKPNDPGWKYDSDNDNWFKDEKKQYDIYSPEASGTFGAGNITPRKNAQREVAAHFISAMHGIDLVPVTVLRNENGQDHSVQAWKDGYADLHTLRKTGKIDPETSLQNDFEVLKSMVPKAKHKELEEKLMDTAVFDIIINNNDRHSANFIVNPETGDLSLIDHGFSFCNSMHGIRNHFLHNVFHGNKPIKMSQTMMTNLGNKSLGDYKRAMPGLHEWEAGQAFLRNRYVLYLQTHHGSIDRHKFLHTMSNQKGTLSVPGDESNWEFVGDSKKEQMKEYYARETEGMLPYQLFESWAKAYIDEAKNNTEHPDHHNAKELDRIGVFMQSGFPMHEGGPEGYRKSGKHREYEASIKPNLDVPKSVFYHMETIKSEREINTRNMLNELTRDKVGEASTRPAPLGEEVSTKIERPKK